MLLLSYLMQSYLLRLVPKLEETYDHSLIVVYVHPEHFSRVLSLTWHEVVVRCKVSSSIKTASTPPVVGRVSCRVPSIPSSVAGIMSSLGRPGLAPLPACPPVVAVEPVVGLRPALPVPVRVGEPLLVPVVCLGRGVAGRVVFPLVVGLR